MSPNETDLQATLRADAERIDAIGDFAGAAIALDRRRSRRRVTVAAAAAAAAVAVATPLIWSQESNRGAPLLPAVSSSATTTGSATGTPTLSSPPASPTPTTPATPAPAQTTRPGPAPTRDSDGPPAVTGTVRLGPVTGTPTVGYVLDGTYHVGSRTVPLPRFDAVYFVADLAGGGVLVQGQVGGSFSPLYVLDASGTILEQVSRVTSARASTDGSRAAYVRSDGTLVLVDARGNQLESVSGQSRNTTVSGFDGDVVYFGVTADDGTPSVLAWDTSTGDTRTVTQGQFTAVHEGRGLALLLPLQDYDPGNTCYAIYDLRADAVRHWSCGEFAPSEFTSDGAAVFGPNVADGAGSSNWKVASTDDGRILLELASEADVWAPTWRSGPDPDTVVLAPIANGQQARQTIVTCAITTGSCTVDLSPVSLGTNADLGAIALSLR